MTSSKSNEFRRVIFMSLVLFVLPVQSVASGIPGFQKPVSIVATNESVHQVINTLFAQIGVPVKIESNINGMINGQFSGAASEVFDRISKTYNVHAYYSRSVAYVYKADQISERILPMSTLKAGALMKLAKQMNLLDARNAVYLINGAGVEVVGNQRFVDKMEELAQNLHVADKSKNPNPVKTSSKRKEKTVREFKLKYASVDDTTLSVGGQDVRIPGVATLLRQFIDGDFSGYGESAADLPENLKTNLSDPKYRPHMLVHRHTNSIWIEDSADRMAVYERMITSIDQQPKMIEIEATIIDINNTKQKELGIDWRLTDDRSQISFGGGATQDSLLNGVQQITSPAAGGIVEAILGDKTQFITRINALEDLGAARVVSTPHITTLSNVEAILGSAREFSVRLEGRDAVDLRDISYGTVLRVTPRFTGNSAGDGILLDYSIEDGSVTGGSVDDIPERESSVVSAKNLVQSGQSLLIGGLTRETSKDFKSKVPLLGDIPGLGKIFQSNRRENTITERLFLITPRIVGASLQSGPVLQGDATSIVDSSELRRQRLQNEVFDKSNRQTDEINGKKPVHRLAYNDASTPGSTPVLDRESIRRLLIIPGPTNNDLPDAIMASLPRKVKPGEGKNITWEESRPDEWQAVKQ